jgi:hypothetical protein
VGGRRSLLPQTLPAVTLNQQNLGFMVSAALIPTVVPRLGLRVQVLREAVTPVKQGLWVAGAACCPKPCQL